MPVSIDQSSNQIDAQPKTLSTIAIPLREESKHFQATDQMLNTYPLSTLYLVGLPLCVCQLSNNTVTIGWLAMRHIHLSKPLA